MNLERYSPRAFLPPSTRMSQSDAAMKTEQILHQWKDAGYVVPLVDDPRGPRIDLWNLADGIAVFFRKEGNRLFGADNELHTTEQAVCIVGVLAKLSQEGVMNDFAQAFEEKNEDECRRLMVFAYRKEAKDFAQLEPYDCLSAATGFKADRPYRPQSEIPLGSIESSVSEKLAVLENIKTVRLTTGGEVLVESAAELAERIQSGKDMRASILAQEQEWPERIDKPEDLRKFLDSLRVTYYRAHQEPLMYPQFSDELDRAKAVGCSLLMESFSDALLPEEGEGPEDEDRIGCKLLTVLQREFSAAERPSGLKGVMSLEDLNPRLMLEEKENKEGRTFEECFADRLMEYAEAGWQIPENLLNEETRAPLVEAFKSGERFNPDLVGASYAADSALAEAAKLAETGLLNDAMNMTGKDLAERILVSWSPDEYEDLGITSEVMNATADATAKIDWERFEPGKTGMSAEELGPGLMKSMRIAVSQGGMGLPIFMNNPLERERAQAIADRLEEIGEVRIADELHEVCSRTEAMVQDRSTRRQVFSR